MPVITNCPLPGSPIALRIQHVLTALVLLGIALMTMPGTSNGQAAVPAATNWAQASPVTSPSARYGATMAYDAATRTVVLFGGRDSSNTYLADTWTWDGTTWTQQSPAASPSPRNESTMSYDAATGTIVLFGGTGGVGSRLADTWTWNGSNWTQLTPASSPSARFLSTTAYDDATGTVVLFGGEGTTAPLNDTWTWNGTTWTQQSPSTIPTSRYVSHMAYNAANGTVVLFGGLTSGSGGFLADTWVWNGTNWTQVTPSTSPSARQGGVMSYDPAIGTVILFGGSNSSFVNLNDTWSFNGTAWTQLTPPAVPPARYLSNSAYDAATGLLVLFGGSGNTANLNDTWNFGQPANFGTVAVGASASATATFNVTTAGTLKTPIVLTQGAPNLDFTLGTGSTCTGSVAVGTCTVSVNFAPLGPGQRLGAVELTNSSGTVIATAFVSGIGSGPQATLAPGTISTIAGTGNPGYVASQDGGPATSAQLYAPNGMALDGAGNVYFSDSGNSRIRKITVATGIITTVAGNGTYGYVASQDGGPATSAEIASSVGIAIDGAGNLYIADSANNRVRKVTAATGVITTLAGTTSHTYVASQDGGPASSAALYNPTGVAVDGAGNVYIADQKNHRVRLVTAATGIITTVAGNGTPGYVASQDGGAAIGAELNNPAGVAVDSFGNLYIADSTNQRIREVTAVSGIITTVAGNGTYGPGAQPIVDGIAATSSELGTPSAVTLDAARNIYIADYADQRIRRVAFANGIITTVAGGGGNGGVGGGYVASQDGGPSTNAVLYYPYGVATDGSGNLYIGDSSNFRVRKILAKASISFPTATAAGASDTTDGTQTATLNNIGNLPLTIASMANATTGSFTLANPLTGGCTTSVTVAVGGSCLLGEQFAPAAGSSGGVSNALIVTDNSLNVTGTAQSVPLLGTTMAGAVTVSVSAPSVIAGTASDPITLIVGYSGTAADTGAITLTVNGSATGVGTPTCSAKGGHMNCAYPYTGTVLRSAGNYTISVAVAADSNYSAGSATGTLAVTAAPLAARPVKPVNVAKPIVSQIELK